MTGWSQDIEAASAFLQHAKKRSWIESNGLESLKSKHLFVMKVMLEDFCVRNREVQDMACGQHDDPCFIRTTKAVRLGTSEMSCRTSAVVGKSI